MATGHDGPRRIRLSRKRGWRKPEGAIVVSRPSKWGNPFPVGKRMPPEYGGEYVPDRATSVALYREAFEAFTEGTPYPRGANPLSAHWTPESFTAALTTDLRGHDLACWCPLPAPGEPDLCHAATLLTHANP
ncbi:DUF4326 domain-containing protein [Actinocorallia sp. A-T 12471]|uniref:DUF4326 domain-containing protein n=1 Tax=Actinocorallia sp. A-T 12471 TaxID=3089813 RepID=UPI0029CD0026|nr:DUF4326 domain-containing protein [Actinocorallia sp. A-T 12471]MDX6740263.1 DUF4326 domain-containing protein [Actinocorallia sp. A-T 12471]